MKQINIFSWKTPYGELLLGSCDDRLCLCDWRYRKMRTAVDSRLKKYLNAEFVEQDNQLLQDVRRQLEEYFASARKQFDIPLLPAGSDFQKRVWQALLRVPYGLTATYLQLAETLGDPKAVRAVAAANGANAISIIVPCHRIIGSSGELVGYAGGIKVKEKLLDLEQGILSLL